MHTSFVKREPPGLHKIQCCSVADICEGLGTYSNTWPRIGITLVTTSPLGSPKESKRYVFPKPSETMIGEKTCHFLEVHHLWVPILGSFRSWWHLDRTRTDPICHLGRVTDRNAWHATGHIGDGACLEPGCITYYCKMTPGDNCNHMTSTHEDVPILVHRIKMNPLLVAHIPSTARSSPLMNH